jgi:hypothetical protein
LKAVNPNEKDTKLRYNMEEATLATSKIKHNYKKIIADGRDGCAMMMTR